MESLPPVLAREVGDSSEFWRRLGAECRRSTDALCIGLGYGARDPMPEWNARPARPFRDDTLLEIEPAVYVEKLARVIVPRSGLIRCPFPEHQDRNRSMKVYTEPERGVWCFGCMRGGSIYDFAAALWGYGTRGDDFKALRKVIAEAMLK
jgi:hypothetical protein